MAFGKSCSAMLPINGRPTIHWSLHYLKKSGVERVVAVIRKGESRLQQFVRQCFGPLLALEFIEIDDDRGPGYSLALGLAQVGAGEPCLVVLGDTLFAFPALDPDAHSGDFVLTSPVSDAPRWCLAQVKPGSSTVSALADKPEENPENWPALIGVYHFADATPAQTALAAEIASGNRSIQIRHALLPYIAAGTLQAYPAAEWFDCGHADFLSHSRRRLLKARDFNSLQLDDLRGTLTKRSTHTQKFLGEINFYRLLPDDLASFFPRLLGYSMKPSAAFLTLEYYGYPTLSELWVFERYDAAFWSSVFAQLARVLDCFREYSLKLSSTSVFHFYWTKTLDRVATFRTQSDDFASLVDAPSIVLNGTHLDGWPVLLPRVEEAVRALCGDVSGCIIHGDLCFPNMLFDPIGRIFKFIDPRGSFGETGLFGDARYDLAKVLHSIDGGYDFLIHEMFSVSRHGATIELQQFFPENREAVLKDFADAFGRLAPLREIRLIEGLLFISMCPLHSDAPDRQLAMFSIGLRILNEVLATHS